MGADDFDVVVIGAGTAGANVAYQFARRGRRVALVERRAAAAAGAQWHNGLLDAHFDRAGLDRPTGEERAGAHATTHLRARDPRLGVTLTASPTVTVDMALLGQRLRALATDAGAKLYDSVRGTDFSFDPHHGRPERAVLHRADAASVSVRAPLFVDAAGWSGVLRRHVPALAPWCPPPLRDELCSAADAEHEITDPAAAEAFLAHHGAQPGETVTRVGTHGGFSTIAVHVAADLGHVGILVGCLANGRYGTGPRMIAELRAQQPWIGDPTRAGAGVIPLRRPYARITAPGVALVGDAASQVFPAHGSGVGMGLMAGTVLAEGAAHHDDPGDEAHLWAGYQARFQQEFGGTLLAYDVLRRASTALGADGVDRLVRAGLLNETTSRTGLDQRWEPPPARESARSAARLARHPGLARVMVPALTRAGLLAGHGARHPQRLDLGALTRWERRAVHLLGPLPR